MTARRCLSPGDVILMLVLLNMSLALSVKLGVTINTVSVGFGKYPILRCCQHMLNHLQMQLIWHFFQDEIKLISLEVVLSLYHNYQLT